MMDDRKITSISLTQEEYDFITTFGMSPTHIVKSKIQECKEFRGEIEVLRGRMARTAAELNRRCRFIEENGETAKYDQWEKTQDV